MILIFCNGEEHLSSESHEMHAIKKCDNLIIIIGRSMEQHWSHNLGFNSNESGSFS